MLLAIFVGFPFLALVPGIVFLALGARFRSRVAQTVGALWLLYCAYEYGMKARVLCSGECNIRVDLVLAYPILWGWSLAAIVSLVRRRRPRSA